MSGRTESQLREILRMTGENCLRTYSAAHVGWIDRIIAQGRAGFSMEFKVVSLGHWVVKYSSGDLGAIEEQGDLFWSDRDAEIFCALDAQYFLDSEV